MRDGTYILESTSEKAWRLMNCATANPVKANRGDWEIEIQDEIELTSHPAFFKNYDNLMLRIANQKLLGAIGL